MDGHLIMEGKEPPIPDGTKWEATGHTHGAWKEVIEFVGREFI